MQKKTERVEWGGFSVAEVNRPQPRLETISAALYHARQALFRPDHVDAEARRQEALEEIQRAENALPELQAAQRNLTLYRKVLEETANVMQVALSLGDPVGMEWIERRMARINRALGATGGEVR